jgi:hypothetical protein
MDYRCYCGEKLCYSQEDDRWFCPRGHGVYSCKQCAAKGKNTPLEWIPQYQRWYCLECKQYAQSSTPTKTAEDTTRQKTEELEENEGEEEFEIAEEDIQLGNYKLGFTQGSRVDEICFNCRHLVFTENNTHLKCNRGQPYFSEPEIAEVTIRPTNCPKCQMKRYNVCLEFNGLPISDVLNSQKWKEYIEKQVRKQIINHEKDAAPVEMYRIEFIDTNPAVEGARAVPFPITRENIMEGRVFALIDKTNRKIWTYAGVKEPGKLFTGLLTGPSARLFAGYEDPFSNKYLRDLLRRDVESFSIERVYLEKETSEFWEVIDRGTVEQAKHPAKQVESKPLIEGPRFEMFQMKFHIGKSYAEYYTGGRSENETKAITLEPLKASLEELDPKKLVLVIDHETRIVWLWIGSKSARLMKTFIKAGTTMSQSRRQQLGIIGSRISRNLQDYEYVAVEENKEPDQFRNLISQMKAN